jgi:tetratricopeptide (TPR) repeat protein
MRILIGLFLLLATFSSCKESDEVKKERFLLKGNEQMKDGEYREAIRYYTESLSIDPDYADALHNRGVAWSSLGDYARAGQDFQAAFFSEPNRIDILLHKAINSIELKEYFSTLSDLEMVKKQVPDTPIVYFAEGLALWQLKRFDEAIQAFDSAELFDPYNPEVPVNRASLRYFIGDYEGAKADLSEGLILDPNEPNAYNVLGLIAEKEGKLDSAFYYVEKALQLKPNEPYFLNNRGYYHLKEGNLQEAEKDINRSIRLDADNPWAYRNKGLLYMAQERWEEAIRNLQVASEMDAQVEQVFFYLGESYRNLGKNAEACEAWSSGKRWGDPQSEEALLTFCK